METSVMSRGQARKRRAELILSKLSGVHAGKNLVWSPSTDLPALLLVANNFMMPSGTLQLNL